MFVTKKKYAETVDYYTLQIAGLREELSRSRDMKDLLSKLTRESDNFINFASSSLSSGHIMIPDNVPILVDDHFGGKTIRQQATKVVTLDRDGNAKHGFTARPPDLSRTFVFLDESKQ